MSEERQSTFVCPHERVVTIPFKTTEEVLNS